MSLNYGMEDGQPFYFDLRNLYTVRNTDPQCECRVCFAKRHVLCEQAFDCLRIETQVQPASISNAALPSGSRIWQKFVIQGPE